MSPCASNAPGRRNKSRAMASNCVPRVDVVCGMSVISARSASPIGALNTKQGRILAVMPRSTSHTSPRTGYLTRLLPADRTEGKPRSLTKRAPLRLWRDTRGAAQHGEALRELLVFRDLTASQNLRGGALLQRSCLELWWHGWLAASGAYPRLVDRSRMRRHAQP